MNRLSFSKPNTAFEKRHIWDLADKMGSKANIRHTTRSKKKPYLSFATHTAHTRGKTIEMKDTINSKEKAELSHRK